MALLGLGATTLAMATTQEAWGERLFLGVLGLAFSVVGLFVASPRPLVFDGRTRTYSGRGVTVPFDDVHALQLIAERIEDGDGGADYLSYELNLVRRDGTRVTVVDHGDLEAARHAAEKLSAMVGCAVWDATR